MTFKFDGSTLVILLGVGLIILTGTSSPIRLAAKGITGHCVVFNPLASKEQVVTLAKKYHLSIHEINSVFEDNVGGYFVDSGQGIEDSLEDYENRTKSSLERINESFQTKESIAMFGEPETNKLYNRHLREIRMMNSTGLQIQSLETRFNWGLFLLKFANEKGARVTHSQGFNCINGFYDQKSGEPR